MITKREMQFWEKVRLTADTARCWEWQGCRLKTGYGTTSLFNKKTRAHRMAFYFANGYMPKHFVLHSCDNRLCVNPNHLSEGDAARNLREMSERGRSYHGNRHHFCKITEADAIRVKAMLSDGVPQADIAREFGIVQSAVSRINTGKNWKHVQGGVQ